MVRDWTGTYFRLGWVGLVLVYLILILILVLILTLVAGWLVCLEKWLLWLR